MFGKLFDFISGKKPEPPEEHIARLTRLAQEEEQKTLALKKKQDDLKMINDLQKKVLSERKTQTDIYAQMGMDSPQVQKSKRTRMIIWAVIGFIIILIVAKSCFK